MSASSRKPESPFSYQIQEFMRFFLLQVERILKIAFAMTQAGGGVRNLVLIWGSIILWIFIALTTRPFDTYVLQGISESLRKIVFFFANPDPIKSLLEGILKTGIFAGLMLSELLVRLLSALVLRHVVPIVVTYYIAFRIATLYLKDIFELDHENVAARFIRQTAFAFTYHTLTIEDGKVSEKDKKDSPMVQIGGPGIVKVHMENVAVFEKPSGEVHIIGQKSAKNKPSVPVGQKPAAEKPTNVLDGFERLREVIDLRNQRTQTNELEVDGRTRDGIRIKAKNVLIDFSLLRDASGGLNSFAANPFTYQEDGIKSLVYKRGHQMPWTGVMMGMVRRNLQEFIVTNRLSEFLAASDLPRIANQGSLLNFISRQALTEFFMSPRFKKLAAAMGMQLNWIDVGTWAAPDASIQVSQKNLEAWEITCQNEIRRKAVPTAVKESRMGEITRLIGEFPLVKDAEERAQDRPAEERKINLISAYLGMLRTAQDDLVQRQAPRSPELDAAINFLSAYLNDYQVRAGKYRFVKPNEQTPSN
jgi:hypothetical protein